MDAIACLVLILALNCMCYASYYYNEYLPELKKFDKE